ncbi:nicotinamide N-methyltransferase-like [Elgaria multicarinata webbii]|uniref:nicotinamide N-methyltransferase-like n=1 Tax=Elgaria multicarinata webbii TaxID=159646 RepID=UPI002FCCBE9C
MAEFTGGEVYQAEFDPKAYLEYFKFGECAIGDEVVTIALKNFCKAFSSGLLKGDTLIDIGSGPTIYQLLSACESFTTIIASDYIEQNCQELQKWLKNEPGAFDWAPVVKYVCELEGNRDKWAEKEAKLRKAVKQVLKCDIHQSNPMDPLTLPPADCVLSVECLEGACKDKNSFRAALRNMSSLLKISGHLVLAGVLGCNFYMVGSRRFSSLNLTEEFMREAICANGFALVEFKVQPRVSMEMSELSDFAATYFIIARKEKEA